MVFRKLLAGLGFGGVEADTILPPTAVAPGGVLSGQVNLRVKSDTELTAITLILVARTPTGEAELSRQQVAGSISLTGGSNQSVPFRMDVPTYTPFTVLYGQALPGVGIGVRTQLSVVSGSAKGDFDPVAVDATAVHQQLMDALGAIGARFIRHEVRPGALAGLPAAQVQAITFAAPVAEGQPFGPHIPQITFLVLSHAAGLTVVAELAHRPGAGDTHQLTLADIDRLSADEGGWIEEVDGWLLAALEKLGQAPVPAPGAFLQQQPGGQPGYGQPGSYGQPGYGQPGRPGQPGYAYGGRSNQGNQGYQYGGYQRGPSMAGGLMAGVAGGALGFLGGMMIADMLTPDMPADMGAMADPGVADAGGYDAGEYDAGGYDAGGGDFGGGDFGGGDFGGGEF